MSELNLTAVALLRSDGTIEDVNSPWVDRLGAEAYWLGRTFASALGDADQDSWANALGRRERAELELKVMRSDQVTVPVLFQLSPGRGDHLFLAALPSPASQVVASAGEGALREELAQARAQLEEVLERMPDGAVVLRESQFIYANPAAARILGYDSPEELVGVHYSAIVRPEELPKSVDRVQRMSQGAPHGRNERPMVRRDGTTVYAETVGFQLRFRGEPATLVIAHDVTDKQRVEAQVRQADRLASLGLLAAGVAHELNNPLAYVLLSLSQVRRCLKESMGPGTSPRLKDAAELVEQSLEGAERMRVILGDLRAFASMDDRQSVLLDVHGVLDSVIPLAEHHLAPRARLVRDYGDVGLVRANEARLGQVFLNLLVNAAQAIPEGAADRNEVRVSTAVEGDKVLVRVRDTGTGMPPETLRRAFEPFFTTKPADSGTGLGLSVCLGIVQGLGGTIEAKSEPGSGSTFCVMLPTGTLTAEVQAQPRVPSRRSRVLVVDDEPNIAKRLAEILEEHQVVVVTSGREAIARLQEENFDLVFCDLMMRDVNGMEVFSEAKRLDAGLADRFIFMTAGAFTPHARAFLDRVPNPRLDKPFTPLQVLSVLNLVLGLG